MKTVEGVRPVVLFLSPVEQLPLDPCKALLRIPVENKNSRRSYGEIRGHTAAFQVPHGLHGPRERHKGNFLFHRIMGEFYDFLPGKTELEHNGDGVNRTEPVCGNIAGHAGRDRLINESGCSLRVFLRLTADRLFGAWRPGHGGRSLFVQNRPGMPRIAAGEGYEQHEEAYDRMPCSHR